MSNLIDAVEGRQSIAETGAETLGQLVPLRSLLGWVNRGFLDPVFRKPEAKTDFTERFFQTLAKDIPGLSQFVPEIKGASERQFPIGNVLSPLRFNVSNARGERSLQQIRREQRNKARLDAIKQRTERGGASLGSLLSK